MSAIGDWVNNINDKLGHDAELTEADKASLSRKVRDDVNSLVDFAASVACLESHLKSTPYQSHEDRSSWQTEREMYENSMMVRRTNAEKAEQSLNSWCEIYDDVLPIKEIYGKNELYMVGASMVGDLCEDYGNRQDLQQSFSKTRDELHKNLSDEIDINSKNDSDFEL